MIEEKIKATIEVEIWDDEVENFKETLDSIIRQGDSRMPDEIRVGNTLVTEIAITGYQLKEQ